MRWLIVVVVIGDTTVEEEVVKECRDVEADGLGLDEKLGEEGEVLREELLGGKQSERFF